MDGKQALAKELRLLLVVPILGAFAAKPILLVVTTWEEWLTVDYGVRLLFLFYVFAIPSVRAEMVGMFRRSWPDSVGPLRALIFIAVVLAAVMIELPIEQIRRYVYVLVPGTELFNYFEIENRYWLIVDLTFGLLLVAISEELSFRGFLIRILSSFTSRPIVLVVVSAFIFGLVHWTNGLQNVVAACLTGLVLATVYLRSKSLWPCVVIHYLINLRHFWPG